MVVRSRIGIFTARRWCSLSQARVCQSFSDERSRRAQIRRLTASVRLIRVDLAYLLLARTPASLQPSWRETARIRLNWIESWCAHDLRHAYLEVKRAAFGSGASSSCAGSGRVRWVSSMRLVISSAADMSRSSA